MVSRGNGRFVILQGRFWLPGTGLYTLGAFSSPNLADHLGGRKTWGQESQLIGLFPNGAETRGARAIFLFPLLLAGTLLISNFPGGLEALGFLIFQGGSNGGPEP